LLANFETPKASLSEKYPGGVKTDKKLLQNEGFTVTQKGKKYFVENYQNCIK